MVTVFIARPWLWVTCLKFKPRWCHIPHIIATTVARIWGRTHPMAITYESHKAAIKRCTEWNTELNQSLYITGYIRLMINKTNSDSDMRNTFIKIGVVEIGSANDEYNQWLGMTHGDYEWRRERVGYVHFFLLATFVTSAAQWLEFFVFTRDSTLLMYWEIWE